MSTERLSASGALEGLLPGVGAMVPALPGGKRNSASSWTCVQHVVISGNNPQLTFQDSSISKVFGRVCVCGIIEVQYMRGPMMGPDVEKTCQVRCPGESGGTEFAGEGPLVGGVRRLQVELEGRRRRERAGADRARRRRRRHRRVAGRGRLGHDPASTKWSREGAGFVLQFWLGMCTTSFDRKVNLILQLGGSAVTAPYFT